MTTASECDGAHMIPGRPDVYSAHPAVLDAAEASPDHRVPLCTVCPYTDDQRAEWAARDVRCRPPS